MHQTTRKNTRGRLLGASLTLLAGTLAGPTLAHAQNPLITDQFSADPSAHVFNGKVYVYPSHDIPAPDDYPRKDWFCMADYHVFSSENLTDWTDHGVIVDQKKVPWVDGSSYSMWAPDCAEKDGKFYFYFPANVKGGRGSAIGVAIADDPGGPFTPQDKPIEGVRGIDPCIFMDTDGTPYLYWAQGRIFVAKLKPNMLELDGPITTLQLPASGLIEGPFTFKRGDTYYLTYPHAANGGTERLDYATSKNPMGPFEFKGTIMDKSASGCWTNHQSIIHYKDQWILFYHNNQLSPKFDKNRAIQADYLHFNDDGTIQKVEQTLRGVGVSNAKEPIQVDRYSAVSSADAASDSFNNPDDTFKGWKIELKNKGTWVRYDRVDFGSGVKSVVARVASPEGGSLSIHLDKPDAPAIAKIDVAKGADMSEVKAELSQSDISGQHDLIVTNEGDSPVQVDWVKFE